MWERQVRTLRKLLSSVGKEQVLHEGGLNTLMFMVQSIVNSRPITVVSDEDLEPLTHNHLLLRSGDAFLHDEYVKEDTYSRRWLHYFANTFWKRWVREYLPTL